MDQYWSTTQELGTPDLEHSYSLKTMDKAKVQLPSLIAKSQNFYRET